MEDVDHQSDSGAAEENLISSLHEIVAKNDVQHLTSKLSIEDLHIDLNNLKNKINQTPLHVAAINNKGQSHFKVSEILLKQGAGPNDKDCLSYTPLWYLIKAGNKSACDLEILKLFLKFKADFTLLDKHGTSLLVPSTYNCNNIDVVKFLIEDIGLDVNSRDRYDGATPLHEVARYNQIDSHYEILKYLLEKGADANARDEYGSTPLYYLVRTGNWRIIKLLLDYNADVYSVTNDGRSIIFGFDDYLSDSLVLDTFINVFGLDVNFLNECNETPLHFIFKLNAPACQFNVKVIKCFFKNGADINIPDNFGFTPLISAVNCEEAIEKEWFLNNLDYFNFIIGQTDFSVIHNNTHIFKNNINRENQDNYYPGFLLKWIVEHLAKLKFLSIPIHPTVLKYINERIHCNNYFEKCTKELKVMSKTKPPSSWITYSNLLVDTRRKLKNYAGNENLIEDHQNSDWLKMFSIYGTLLKKNVEKGIRRRKLFNKSSILLSDRLPIFNPNHLIVKDTFDCILSKKDLSKFCE